MRKLCDEDVGVEDHLVIFLLSLSDDVGQPLVLLLVTCHPQEVHLPENIHEFERSEAQSKQLMWAFANNWSYTSNAVVTLIKL